MESLIRACCFLRRNLLILALAALAVVAAVLPLHALETDTTVTLAPAVDFLAGYLEVAFAALITVIVSYVARLAHRWFGLHIDRQHRETLHSAIVTGLRAALEAARARSADTTIDLKSAVVADAYNWVLTAGARDAAKHFKLTPEALQQLIASKVTQVRGETSTGSAAPGPP